MIGPSRLFHTPTGKTIDFSDVTSISKPYPEPGPWPCVPDGSIRIDVYVRGCKDPVKALFADYHNSSLAESLKYAQPLYQDLVDKWEAYKDYRWVP